MGCLYGKLGFRNVLQNVNFQNITV